RQRTSGARHLRQRAVRVRSAEPVAARIGLISSNLCPVAQWNQSTAVRRRGSRVRVAPGQPFLVCRTEGGAWRHATGLENRADLTVEGSTPSPSSIFSIRVLLLPPVCKTGVYETGRSADERFESSGTHQQ